MRLVIGGAFQGKTKAAQERYGFVREEVTDGKSCKMDEIYNCRVLCHFHEYVRRMMEQNRDLSGFMEKLSEENPDIILLCNEIGYGVVPVDRFEREYRETVGRLCCQAAELAAEVVRVVCGIGAVIKSA